MSSISDKFSGKTKQTVGKATDNPELQAKGAVQETRGDVTAALKDTGEKITDKVDEVTKKVDV